ncbi:retrovirus-related pol polyprotein from transposon TNT 1-94 [Tanacetum coccineum]
MTSTHQQSLADVGSETRPPMLERESYVPWASQFMRYIERKKDTRKFLKRSIEVGPYKFKKIPATDTADKTTEKEDDLTGDDLKQYETNIDAMNLILLPIPNDIYNSVDACENAKDMWDRPEWNKYVTNVRLTKNLKEDPYDVLFDHLQQYEGLVNASRAKRAAKTHDPLALVANTYAREAICDDQEDSLTTTMMLLARAITQRYSTPTNNRLRTSSNTRNQAVVQADRVDIQSKNVGNGGRYVRRTTDNQGDSARNGNVKKETGNGNVQRILRTTANSGNASNVQCYNCNAKGHYARDCLKPRVRDSKYFLEQMLLAKKNEDQIILTHEHNDFLLVDAFEI